MSDELKPDLCATVKLEKVSSGAERSEKDVPIYKRRPPHPIPPAPPSDPRYEMTLSEYVQLQQNPTALTTFGRNVALKKIVLTEIEKHPDMWSSRNGQLQQRFYPMVAVEVYKRTGCVFSTKSIMNLFKVIKDTLRLKLRFAIVKRKMSAVETEAYLWKWELYGYCRFFRSRTRHLEASLKREALNDPVVHTIDDDDDVNSDVDVDAMIDGVEEVYEDEDVAPPPPLHAGQHGNLSANTSNTQHIPPAQYHHHQSFGHPPPPPPQFHPGYPVPPQHFRQHPHPHPPIDANMTAVNANFNQLRRVQQHQLHVAPTARRTEQPDTTRNDSGNSTKVDAIDGSADAGEGPSSSTASSYNKTKTETGFEQEMASIAFQVNRITAEQPDKKAIFRRVFYETVFKIEDCDFKTPREFFLAMAEH
ncbi:unnamed protein product [Caenorhabditis sp. 36 PRJEB53466]|nr:unnamed protein product [Caenorhabditis sp. 36 PRJEB53466]